MTCVLQHRGCVNPEQCPAACVLDGAPQRMIDAYDIPTGQVPVGAMISYPIEAGWYVYIQRDADGGVLYVGYTGNPAVRMANHALGVRSPWFRQVASIDWERHASRAAALARESILIEELRPPFNKAGVR